MKVRFRDNGERSGVFWVDYREALLFGNLTEYLVCGNKMIHQSSIPQFRRDCQLQGVKGAKTQVKRVALKQQFGHRKFRFRHRKNFQLPRYDVCSKLAQEHIGILTANGLSPYLDRERRDQLSRG